MNKKYKELIELNFRNGMYIASIFDPLENYFYNLKFIFCNKKQVLNSLRNEYNIIVSNKLI